MQNDRSIDRVVDRLAFAPERVAPRADEPDREARILAHIRRIRSDPRWLATEEASSAA